MLPVKKPVLTVQVRELVAFALRRGDLGGERDFVGPSRALAGTRGHQRLQRSRPASYQKEVRLSHDIDAGEFILRVQGRIDGLLTEGTAIVLEEIKTVQGGWDGNADPLHWAQAKCYGFIYALEHALTSLVLQLTYLDLDTGGLSELRNSFTLAELETFFHETTVIYLEWVRDRYQWCQLRDESIRNVQFPFANYRPGQRELAVAAYRTLAKGGRLFLEAPTGIGKTVSVLFPAVKALGEGKLERIFYLTARTSGRAVAQKAFADLRATGLRLRSLTLTAKEKICVQAGQPCDPQLCPLARGYYDRNKPAMREALGHEEITRAVVEAVGAKHQVCPFELSLDLSVWVDTVICDYNYLFDPKVYLRRHFAETAGDYGFLVDEAHNLVDRGREMFSAGLTEREVHETRRAMKRSAPACARALNRLSSALRQLCAVNAGLVESLEPSAAETETDLFTAGNASSNASDASALERQLAVVARREGVKTRRELPLELMLPLDDALKEAENWLAKNEPSEFRDRLLELYFRLHSFRRTAELYDERYVTILEPEPEPAVRLFCLDPSFLLREALTRGKAAIFFSATLTPIDYYRELLGGSPEDPLLQLRSPFAPENLAVLVQDRIQTQFKARTRTLDAVVQSIGRFVEGRKGNYLVYLPSYQYLEAVQAAFRAGFPDVPMLTQTPGMSEAERDAFLEAFAVEHGKTLVGFAVMGGVFAEGIDLVGDRLIGAIIVGVGLPQLCVERDLIREYFQEKTGAGFEYAYTFPGMNRVLQATGRVIRSETDRGVVLLIDTRFAQPPYDRLFPAWWPRTQVRNTNEIGERVREFWAAKPVESGFSRSAPKAGSRERV